ncbi:Transaldolase [Acaryochloris thomasi RCC1774]|uniref:Transaldolase n=1 Tax=Acaryochloris thomasi RCC1774 TaxID=1764569 RepID=A0A2W1JAP6_9CYAN|nr:bifunctional transaldolase/phosoglucose isomerase [Acaryochloris thomasi]PZD71193.1 Transaldolase [Acaryochloris thomasi RCC1774]
MSLLQTPQKNALQNLQHYGQSVWLDYIRRCSIEGGELQQLVDEEIQGVTSNPAIFQKAIAGSTDYDAALSALERDHDQDAITLYEQLAIADIQAAADILRPLYNRTNQQDGYVSLEVSPYLANDSEQSLIEAQRLWQAVNRPNLMIKVPATPAGIPVIQQLISQGINVNVTLLFSRAAYLEVAEAYLSGLEEYVSQGGSPGHVASVASFFISRIDSAVDGQVAERLKIAVQESDAEAVALLQGLLGKVAIANAKLVYQDYLRLCESERWQALKAQGAQPQRLLWASTGTKNPQYRDTLYVEELIGPETVNTIPPSTLAAFRDHGEPRPSLTEAVEQTEIVMSSLSQVGIVFEDITDQLLGQGVQLFQQAFDQLLSAVEHKREAQLGKALNRQTYTLPATLSAQVQATLQGWQDKGKVRQLWAMDSTLWTGADESQWLGWLGTTEDQLAHLNDLTQLAQEVKDLALTHVLLLGMGGSSLCPEVMKLTFGQAEGYPELLVLDSTDPAQVQAITQQIDLKRTLFIVSSKSGSTLEPNIFQQYFFDLVQKEMGAEVAGSRFIAVTDPGSKLQEVAHKNRFRHYFFGIPSIGGRYSALSNFGMVPAACLGIDVAHFLDSAEEMVHSCAASVPAIDNPGVVLGIILGKAAQQGRDKLTLIASPGIADIGAWLEQLLAESTGKEGCGIIPVDQEPLGPPLNYGADRIFAYIRLEAAPDPAQDKAVAALEAAGQPVIQIQVTDAYQLGQEFFRWEMATAVAGSVLGIHAFNQPDVEASKIATRQLTDAYEETGELLVETPLFQEGGLQLFTDVENAAALTGIAGTLSLCGFLKAHLKRLRANDYFALLAYIQMNKAHQQQLQGIRKAICDRKQVATCLGFGPRFLHSTGQAYKGGPNSGVFLQITCEDERDVPIPGHRYSFGVVKAAQARGDFQVLAKRKRRVLRVHLGTDVEVGLRTLRVAIQGALP